MKNTGNVNEVFNNAQELTFLFLRFFFSLFFLGIKIVGDSYKEFNYVLLLPMFSRASDTGFRV